MSARTYRVETTFDGPLVVGEYVTGSSVGYHRASGRVAYRSTFGGTYVGIQESDPSDEPFVDDRGRKSLIDEPLHMFRDGHINDVPQSVHGIPVANVVDVDRCVTCGVRIDETLNDETAALYASVASAEIIGWACSDACSDAWEDRTA